MEKEDLGEPKAKTNKLYMAFIASMVGCIVGFLVVRLLKNNGYYAIVLVGVFCGFFSLIFMRVRNNFFGLWCGILSFAFTLFTEYQLFTPANGSMEWFLDYLKNQNIKTLFSFIMGPLIAFYFGRGRKSK